jgi:hypothetical protein
MTKRVRRSMRKKKSKLDVVLGVICLMMLGGGDD